MPGEALFYLMVQNVMVNTVLTFGKSVLEHCDGRIVGDWYLDCEHVLEVILLENLAGNIL